MLEIKPQASAGRRSQTCWKGDVRVELKRRAGPRKSEPTMRKPFPSHSHSFNSLLRS